jgi:hypothetical protein
VLMEREERGWRVSASGVSCDDSCSQVGTLGWAVRDKGEFGAV